MVPRSVLVLAVTTLGCSAPDRPLEAGVPTPSATSGQPSSSVAKRAPLTPGTYDIFDGDVLVFQIVDEPGLVLSAAPPPPGGQLPSKHRFLSLVSLSPIHEGRFSGVLPLCNSTREFLDKLEAAGLRVERK